MSNRDYDLLRFFVNVKRQTDKAILVSRIGVPRKVGDQKIEGKSVQLWLPKSQIEWTGKLSDGATLFIGVPRWLARQHDLVLDGPLWEDNAEYYERRENAKERAEQPPPPQSNLPRAYPGPAEIFDLGPAWTEQQLISAHRKLMSRIHPDVGGTTGLAKLVNICKDELLRKSKGATR